jgi:hypothetical protein
MHRGAKAVIRAVVVIPEEVTLVVAVDAVKAALAEEAVADDAKVVQVARAAAQVARAAASVSISARRKSASSVSRRSI